MSTTVDILMPESEDVADATVIAWLVSVGDIVEEHQPLLEISTDKVTLEVAAPASGRLIKILVNDNENIHPGHSLGIISVGDTQPESLDEPKRSGRDVRKMVDAPSTASILPASPNTQSNTQSKTQRNATRLSPLVKKMVSDHAIDVSLIAGSGRDGRVTARDVEGHIAAAPDTGETYAGGELIPHTPMRRKIADHMVQSLLKTSPHVTAVFDMDMSAVMAHRATLKDQYLTEGVRLTYTAYFALATARAIEKNPIVNSQWRENGVQIMDQINLGIAAALGNEGLIVPVLKNADALSLKQMAVQLRDMVERARTGKLQRADIQGGTFTITNHGVSGSIIATPIINQPQAAILGIGKTEKRVVVDDSSGVDSIQVKPMAYVTLTIDHRILDGFQANSFLADFVKVIENWV